MPSPFLSIIIPTKNRSSVLEQAITTVFRQSYQNWELIVVDNDDSDDTKDVCAHFSDDRLRYVRTGGLTMTDNWERGLQAATGDYVTYLQDKNFLRRHALQRIAEVLADREIDFLAWRMDCILDNETPPRLARSKTTGGHSHQPSAEILEQIARTMDGGKFMPFPNYGFMSRALLNRILDGPQKQLCLGLDPALGAALQILTNTDRIDLLDEALFVHAYNRLSNGKNADKQGEVFKLFTRDQGGKSAIYYDHVPIQTVSVLNGAFNEYAKLRRLPGLLNLPEIDLPAYFIKNHEYFWSMRSRGLPIRRNLKLWGAALDKQSSEVKTTVHAHLSNAVLSHSPSLRHLGKIFRKSLGISRIEAILKGRRTKMWPFRNALEYVTWADEHEPLSAHESTQAVIAETNR